MFGLNFGGWGRWGWVVTVMCGCVCVRVRVEKERDTRYDRCREAPSIARFVTCNQALHPLQFHPHIYTQLPVESPGIAATTTSLPTFSIFHYHPLFFYILIIMFDDAQYFRQG